MGVAAARPLTLLERIQSNVWAGKVFQVDGIGHSEAADKQSHNRGCSLHDDNIIFVCLLVCNLILGTVVRQIVFVDG